MSFDCVFVLIVDGIKVFMENLAFEEEISGVNEDILALNVAVPAIFFIQVFINRLTALINGNWFISRGIGLLKVVLAAQTIGPAEGHQNLFIDEVDSAFDEGKLFLRLQVMQSLKNEIFLIF